MITITLSVYALLACIIFTAWIIDKIASFKQHKAARAIEAAEYHAAVLDHKLMYE